MSEASQTSPVISNSQSPSSSSHSASVEPQSGKRGRPSKWTKSRQRKLARLYLYSTLPPKDISAALEESDSTWKPGKESTVKTVNSLLDSQPRWLRPKNREEMDGKISELKKISKKDKGKGKEKYSTPQSQDRDDYFQFHVQSADFSETPLLDLLSVTPPYHPAITAFRPDSSSSSQPHQLFSLPTDLPFLEDAAIVPVDPTYVSPKHETNNALPYGFQEIARGARGRKYHTFYECPICEKTNPHSDSYLDQIRCGFDMGKDRVTPDAQGVTPAHAIIMYQRTNNDAEDSPETPAQTAALFKALFPYDDLDFRRALSILDPSGNTLIHNIKVKGFTEILEYIEMMTADSDEPVIVDKPTAVDAKSMSTYMTTSSLKKRLPQYSTRYLKGITRLIKAHSIADSSSAVTTPTMTPKQPALVPSMAPTVGRSTIGGTTSSSISILPDAFLSIDRHIQRQGICIPGFKAHDAKTCWCHVLDGINSRVWVANTGLVDSRVQDPPSSLHYLNLKFKDNFGNNVLHMLAARGAPFEVLIHALEQGVDGNEKNTADQTFLHVLRRQILRTFAEDEDTLMWVLQRLNVYNVRFHDCDVVGRSFLHLLGRQADKLQHHSLFVLQQLNVRMPAARDAFGYRPSISPAPKDRSIPPEPIPSSVVNPPQPQTYIPAEEPREFRRPNSVIHQPIFTDFDAVPLSTEEKYTPPPVSSPDISNVDEQEAFVRKHARFLEIARSAFTNPRIEDPEGRNGLQCLAEASLTLSIDATHVNKAFSNKRKIDQPEPVRSSARLTLRHELVEKLIAAGVNQNNYDKAGDTVLMAFVKHLQDGEDDKTLAKLLRRLISSGTNINWRNRRGETALHIAVKMGRKVATKVLLESGSNVHARTAEGLGILETAEASYLRAKDDPSLYASIMACMAQCIQYEAVAHPTLVMEWAVKY